MRTPIAYFILLSGILFMLGTVGVLIRRNALLIFMSVELQLNAVNLTLIAFSRMHNDLNGQVIAFFSMVVAAAEVVVGLAIGAVADAAELLAFERRARVEADGALHHARGRCRIRPARSCLRAHRKYHAGICTCGCVFDAHELVCLIHRHAPACFPLHQAGTADEGFYPRRVCPLV